MKNVVFPRSTLDGEMTAGAVVEKKNGRICTPVSLHRHTHFLIDVSFLFLLLLLLLRLILISLEIDYLASLTLRMTDRRMCK